MTDSVLSQLTSVLGNPGKLSAPFESRNDRRQQSAAPAAVGEGLSYYTLKELAPRCESGEKVFCLIGFSSGKKCHDVKKKSRPCYLEVYAVKSEILIKRT